MVNVTIYSIYGSYGYGYILDDIPKVNPFESHKGVPIVRATLGSQGITANLNSCTLKNWSFISYQFLWGLGGHRDILNHIFQYLSIFIQYIFIMGYNFTNQPAADPAHFLLTRWQSFIIETKAKPHKLCDLRNESSGLVSFFWFEILRHPEKTRHLSTNYDSTNISTNISTNYLYHIILYPHTFDAWRRPVVLNSAEPFADFELLSQPLRLTDFEATRFWASCRTSPLGIVGEVCNGRSLAIRKLSRWFSPQKNGFFETTNTTAV